MDIVTQAALGAALATAIAPSRQRRLAAGIGLAAGILPDLDTLIQSGDDPLLLLDFHRHFTHAVAFIPLGALLAALLLWPFLRSRLGFGRLYLYSLAGYGLAGLLDACTSYGTLLWLPFSDARVAWNLIAVFDPAFTLLLIVPLLISLRNTGSRAVHWGLLLAACYLGLGYWQQQRVVARMLEVAQARQHTPERLIVKPTLGNLLLWRTLYLNDGYIHADAVHAGPQIRHYPGMQAKLMVDTPAPQGDDIERFRRFSDGWLVETRPGVIGDARYAMLPTAIDPIWFIRWDTAGKLEFITQHDMSPTARKLWITMLLGRPAVDRCFS